MSNPVNTNNEYTEMVRTFDNANKRIESIPMSTRAGWQYVIEEAQRNLPRAKKAYETVAVGNFFAGVHATGNIDNVDNFTKFVVDNGGAHIPLTFYESLCAGPLMESMSGDRNFSWRTSQHYLFNATVRKVCEELDEQFIEIDFSEKTCGSEQGVYLFARNQIERVYNQRLVVADTIKKLVDEVIKNRLSETKIPVVLTDDRQELLNRPGVATLFTNVETVDVDTILELSDAAVAPLFKFRKKKSK